MVNMSISIHAPREGSDKNAAGRSRTRPYFYPRSPRGERLLSPILPSLFIRISIHAPREGSDWHNDMAQIAQLMISIHAPREGSDP